eukprot:scaffold15_cov354-Prasinococcus_capsulatus_cf.AAC.7
MSFVAAARSRTSPTTSCRVPASCASITGCPSRCTGRLDLRELRPRRDVGSRCTVTEAQTWLVDSQRQGPPS